MHRMADELKTSRRREHRWKLILWSPKNTKEEERKETIEQNTRWPKESLPSHWRAQRKISESTRSNRLKLHKEPQNIRLVDEISFQYNEFLTIQEMADGAKFGRSRASKMADNPNHGIYRGHRLKSPPSSIHIASKEENPDWNEQNWRRPKEDVPGANLKIFQRRSQTTRSNDPIFTSRHIIHIGRQNFKIGRGNLHRFEL
ncbi:unnamed protein product [Microthlaspi erraticum]|uniref:Uncharacterized protein n=1 Tax=Microthlaspi erraticum TaxID=1685480 RepID=A0A6D2HWE4_9BRAS|nr:unnamed protein product [Microthlaspi erraticum]